MARRKILGLLAVSVIMCMLMAASVAPVVAMDSSYKSGDSSAYKDKTGKGGYDGDKYGGGCDKCRCGYDKDKGGMGRDGMCRDGMGYGGMHKEPKDIYMAISGGSMSGTTASFTIDSIGMSGMKDMAFVATPGKPLSGTYNTTSDMGYISIADVLPLTLVIDNVGTTPMPAGNASAIIGLHGVKTLVKEKGYKVSEVRSVSVFLPDGTVKYFKLDEPIKMTHSMDRKMVVIDAYPSFTKRMGSVFTSTGGASYGAMGVSSVTVADLKAAEMKAQKETIGYETPAYVAPPA